MANGGLTGRAPSTVFTCAYACVPCKRDHWIRGGPGTLEYCGNSRKTRRVLCCKRVSLKPWRTVATAAEYWQITKFCLYPSSIEKGPARRGLDSLIGAQSSRPPFGPNWGGDIWPLKILHRPKFNNCVPQGRRRRPEGKKRPFLEK